MNSTSEVISVWTVVMSFHIVTAFSLPQVDALSLLLTKLWTHTKVTAFSLPQVDALSLLLTKLWTHTKVLVSKKLTQLIKTIMIKYFVVQIESLVKLIG